LPNSRTQTIWYTRPAAPEQAKSRASRVTQSASGTIAYTRGSAPITRVT
jgi:hypothetical protein